MAAVQLGSFAGPLAPYDTLAIQRATEQMQGYALSAMRDAVAEAVEASIHQAGKQATEIARVIRERIESASFADVHQAIGLAGQRSVLASFDQTVGRSGNSGGHGYRTGGKWPRYSGGRLRAALASPDFFHATEFGLDFINIALLNRRAAQWAKINFGAAPRGKGTNVTFNVYFGGLVMVSLGIHESPRPAFMVPPGYFVEGGEVARPTKPTPGSEFYVAGTGPYKGKFITNAEGEQIRKPMVTRKRSAGIAARQFLTPGVARVAREIPVRYKGKLDELAAAGLSAVRPAPITIRIDPLRYRGGGARTSY